MYWISNFELQKLNLKYWILNDILGIRKNAILNLYKATYFRKLQLSKQFKLNHKLNAKSCFFSPIQRNMSSKSVIFISLCCSFTCWSSSGFFLTCYIKKLQTYKCRRSAIHCVVEILKTKYINMLISCV
jgi:hypothetical protein